LNYYPFHVGDYASHTMHLDPMEDLAYRRMLDVYYTRDGALPTDVADVARLIRMRSSIDIVKVVLAEFFTLIPSGWHHARCEIEIAKMVEKQEMQRDKALRMWDKKRNAESGISQTPTLTDATASKNNAAAYANANNLDATAMPPTPTPTPTPNNNTKKIIIKKSAFATPDGVCESVWADFVSLRKSKRSSISETALHGINSEATAAGWTLEEALRECCIRGWTSFKADWVMRSEKRNIGNQPAETFRERDDRLARERIAEICPSIAAKPPRSRNVIDITTFDKTPVLGAIK
jgi:uncharacterized protein YdaU (DUF1376 family)